MCDEVGGSACRAHAVKQAVAIDELMLERSRHVQHDQPGQAKRSQLVQVGQIQLRHDVGSMHTSACGRPGYLYEQLSHFMQ